MRSTIFLMLFVLRVTQNTVKYRVLYCYS